MSDGKHIRVRRWPLAVLFVLAAAALAAAGYGVYRQQARAIQAERYGDLKAIAELKAGQIAAWRAERLTDVRFNAASPFLREAIIDWTQHLDDEKLKDRIRSRLEMFRDLEQYENAILATPDGRLLLSLRADLTELEPAGKELAIHSVAAREPVFGDFFICPEEHRIHLDVAAPIPGETGEAAAVLLLRRDPANLLYPLIQSWPTPSQTAETVLLRRDGDHVLFLNVLRHRPEPALTLRIPMSKTEVPAVQAALGKTGQFLGLDYRGVEVLSDVRPIPDSPWFMVAKVDAAEILSELRYRGLMLLFLVVVAILATGGATAFLGSYRSRKLYQALYRAEREQRRSQEESGAILYAIGDGVIATNAQGRVSRLNPVAERLTGWTEAEALGRPLHEVFHIINEETRAKVESPVDRVLREGVVVGLANHTLLVARDGSERPIADSGAPIHDEQGVISGVVLVFRDQSAGRAAEKALRASEARYRRLFEAARDGILILDGDTGRVVDVNPFLTELLGYDHAAFLGKELWEIGLFKDIAASKAAFRELQNKGYIRYEDLPLETADGRSIAVEFVSNAYQVGDKSVIQCNVRDITERRRAKEALRLSEQFAQSTIDALSTHLCVLDDAGTIIAVNKAWRFFAQANQLTPHNVCEGANYLAVCQAAQGEGAEAAAAFLGGVRSVASGERDEFSLEYPCHSPEESRWFVARLTRFEGPGPMRLVAAHENITARKLAEEEIRNSETRLRRLEWMLTAGHGPSSLPDVPEPLMAPPYGDLTVLNTCRVILDSVGPDTLREIANEYLELLDTSTAVYEKNGDYALGIFASGWCRFLDQAGRRRCGTADNGEALACGQWLCHASCWSRASKAAIDTGAPVDVECEGGIRLYAVPIRAHGEVVGAINVGYGDPPRDPGTLRDLAARFEVDADELARHAAGYESRPPFIIDLAKRRVKAAARMIGEIIERKRAEQERENLQAQLLQAQKMESVGRLAGGVAHDFNNMLGVIIGYAQMALDQVDPSLPLHHDLNEILAAAQRSTDLTRQLLAFARRQAISPKVLDLNDTIGSMIKMLQRLIGEDIELVWKPAPGLWPIKIDPAQVDQILANLSVNARDAIAGVGTLTIETDNVVLDEAYCLNHAGFVPGQFVQMALSDTGAGMDKSVTEHLFEPFFTTKETGKGTGLGLATVYGIVKQNDGFINVYSEPGHGTVFKVYLPRASEAFPGALTSLQQKPAHGNETLLMVEDERAILEVGKAILEQYGYTVLAAPTPTQALDLAAQHDGPIHVLITDVVMPEMNGKDLNEQIMALRPGIKTLYMSGYTANVIAHRGVIDEGINFLQKPFSIHTLAAKVREVLDQP